MMISESKQCSRWLSQRGPLIAARAGPYLRPPRGKGPGVPTLGSFPFAKAQVALHDPLDAKA
jgi:hypothetical protein